MRSLDAWKSWSTPLTAFSFAVVGITGVLMLCEVRLPFMRGLHEWIGLLLVLSGALHLVIHWRTFCAYFKRRETWAALAGVTLLALLLLIGGGEGEGPHHGPGGPHGGPPFQESRPE